MDLFQGTEFGDNKDEKNEILNLLLMVNFKHSRIIKIDLYNKTMNFIKLPEQGLSNHFKKINEDSFIELMEKYF